MASDHTLPPDDRVPQDLLKFIRRAGILTKSQLGAVQAKVRAGQYPRESHALARRLVAEEILTEFQARELLKRKTRHWVIGRYVLLERIGSGGMGQVFKARHQLMGRIVALKVLAPDIAGRAHSIARFRREMQFVGRLDHPNVIRAFDADQHDEILYIAMEYVPGPTLEKLLKARRNPLAPDEVIDYAVQAARGLAHAHDQGVVHRDIKPSNLLVGTGGVLKVLDLGLAALLNPVDDDTHSFASSEGLIVGTVDYLSPEQATGNVLDGRSDLYSLGCTIYRLLTNQLPFPGDSKIERLAKRIHSRPVSITQWRPDLPRDLVRVLDRLMATRPEDRFASATEVARVLGDLTRRRREGPRSARPTVSPVPTPQGAPRTSDDLPPLDWDRIEEGLAHRGHDPPIRRVTPEPPRPSPTSGTSSLAAHRRSLEASGDNSGWQVEQRYLAEIVRCNNMEIARLSQALEQVQHQSDEVASSRDDWKKLILDLPWASLVESPFLQILLALLVILLLLRTVLVPLLG